MKTKEINLYRFSEISESAKEKAIDKYYESEEYDSLSEDILEFIKENDTFNVFSNIELYYSLSYSQCDGLSFSADFDLANFFAQKDYSFKKSVLDVIQNNIIDKVSVKSNNGHYCYCKSSDIEIQYLWINKTYKNIDLLCSVIKSHIRTYYLDICKKAEKFGYSILEYRMNFDDFSSFSDDNDYFYTINGILD